MSRYSLDSPSPGEKPLDQSEYPNEQVRNCSYFQIVCYPLDRCEECVIMSMTIITSMTSITR